jgi:hypothetical protein
MQPVANISEIMNIPSIIGKKIMVFDLDGIHHGEQTDGCGNGSPLFEF